MRYSVDAALVKKRARCLGSSYDKPDCGLIYERAVKALQSDKPNKNDIVKFFNECDSPSNANKYYGECLSIINTLGDDKLSKSLKEKYIDSIVPYVENMTSVENEASYAHDPGFYNTLFSTAKEYEVCDRILDNHAKISKRFNIEPFVESSRNKSLNRIVLPCCGMIDTYDLKPHAKMNVCLEEMSYLLQKHDIKYKKDDLVKYVTEYFLTRTPNTSVDTMNDYRRVLSENSMISDNDLDKVYYFTEMMDDAKSPIIKMLDDFTTLEDKSEDAFGGIIKFAVDDDDKTDLINNIDEIYTYIREYLLSDAYGIDYIIQSLNMIPEAIERDMQNDTWKYSRDDLDRLILAYNKEIDQLDLEMANNPDKDLITKLSLLKDCYLNSKARLIALANIVYTNYNIECMVHAEASQASIMYLNEFKILKFDNLLNAARKITKSAKNKSKKLYDKIKGKLKPKNKKNKKGEEEEFDDISIGESLTSYGTSDICVLEFEIIDETDFYQVHDALTEFCKYMNETELYGGTCRAYYKVLPDTVEIHVEDCSDLLLSDDEQEDVDNNCFTDEDKERVLYLQKDADAIDSIDDIDEFANIASTLKEVCSDLDRDVFDTIIEASQFLCTIDEDDVKEMYQIYADNNISSYSESVTTKSALNKWTHYDAPLDLQVEAYDVIKELLEADDEKKHPEKHKDDDKDKEKKPGVIDKIKSKLPGGNKDKDESKDKDKDKNSKEDKKKDSDKEDKNLVDKAMQKINNLKLYTRGIKAKFKDLSNKEKEWSRNLDSYFNMLYTSCKNALTNDRREGIIKGSVIPSFSKCIKLGIALAGITFINPVAGAVAAIGGLAMSKKLNKQERLLLLDELEVEIEVVDKEISMAESRDQMKKMRKLMSYKKDLQRQYQRIKYNIRIGKDILPGSSSTGIHTSES